MRKTAIDLGLKAADTIEMDGFQAVRKYVGQKGFGTFLIDLSHRRRWDLQDKNVGRFKPFGLEVPETPGQVTYENGLFINRMNGTQCSIWHLAGDWDNPPTEPAYTEITDGQALLAIVGAKAHDVLERVTNLDLTNPGLDLPALIQGPVMHIPCQVVVLSGENMPQGAIIGFSRGYGQAMAEALLETGADLGLLPGGEGALGIKIVIPEPEPEEEPEEAEDKEE